MTRKRSIEVPGVTHGDVPIPMGARVGNMIFSSGILGKDPATNKLPAEAADQTRFAFQNMHTLVTRGGGSLKDIARVTVFIKDNALRAHVNACWLEFFPDPQDRPARHTQVIDLPGTMQVQLEMVAVVQGG